MKKKIVTSLLVLLLAFSMLGASAFAQSGQSSDIDLSHQNGKLLISEPGSYVLQGKLTGCVYVDPGQGEVELILDGVDINGGSSAAIAVVSGDRLTVTLPAGSVNRVVDGGADDAFGAAVYSRVETVFEGSGALYVTGSTRNGIQVESAALTFNGGSYAIKAPVNGMSAERLTLNGGHFSVQAASSVDPASVLFLNGGVIEEVAPSQAGSSGITQPTANEGAAVQEAVETETDPTLAPSLPAEVSDAPQSPEPPSGVYDGQQPPELPSGGFDGQQPPGSLLQPGQQSALSTAESASEIVSGTMTNSAASLQADYDNASYITVTDDDSQVTIKSSGTYVVTGSSSDGNITVKKGTSGVVLVLDDLDLTSTTGATVSINKEAEVKIVISGNVVLTDNENPADEDVSDDYDGAALKVKADSQVYMTGDGTLTINGNAKNGIKSGDNSSLIFDGVTVNISAVNDGINGNYDVTLLSGSFTIAAGDDAIHADHILTVGNIDGTGPIIRVTESEEGLEGTVVNFFGGDLSIVSNDDAVNAANGDGLYEGVLDYSFNMLGGSLVIDSRSDGIDSNGNVNLIGGSAEIHSASNGGEAGIDYDGQFYQSDDFRLNNQSSTAGPDGMGGMPGQMGGQLFDDMGGQPSGPMGGQGFGGMDGMPGQMGGQGFGGMGSQRPGPMDGQECGGTVGQPVE